MADQTISMTFKVQGDEASMQKLIKDADGLAKALGGTVVAAEPLKGNIINFAALSQGLSAIQRSFDQLQRGLSTLANAYKVQELAEARLSTVMRQRMGATDDVINSIKELASEQQKIGVIGDEVQLSGAQQVATFLTEADSIKTLLPAMNNLLAQQKGVNATAEDAATIGNLFGKVMQGQTSALKRVGITFSEAEEKVLKYGTESEKAAMLAAVVKNNVGDMNEALAQTDSGKQAQLANTIGDIKEKIGGLVQGALPFVTITAQSATALTSIVTLGKGFTTLMGIVSRSTVLFLASTKAFIANKAATLGMAIAQNTVAAVTKVWTALQVAFNAVMSANPIALVVIAIAALITGLVYAYNHCESFRQVCDKAWGVIKKLGEIIMGSLVKALEWVCAKVKVAWTWLKNLLGLSGETISVDIEIPPTPPTGDGNAEGDGNQNTPPSTPTVKTPKADEPVYNAEASNLKGYRDNIQLLQKELETASMERAAQINAEIDKWQQLASAIEDAGKSAGSSWHEQITSIKDIDENISLLDEKIQTASIDEIGTLNQQREALEKQKAEWQKIGKAVEDTSAKLRVNAATLTEIEENISYYDAALKNATIEEAAELNRSRKMWEEKRDAIRRAGTESVNTFKTMREGWSTVKGLTSGLNTMGNALNGNVSLWKRITSVVDGALGVYDGIKGIVSVLQLLGVIHKANAAAATTEAAATIVSAGADASKTSAAIAETAASVPQIAANKALAASFMEVAAAAFFAAHAYIPFAGFGIAAGFISAASAMVLSMNAMAFANGGIAYGPTLGLFGEYAGASNNPEVVAPLDKLRSLIAPQQPISGEVEFKLRGEALYGVLKQYNKRIART